MATPNPHFDPEWRALRDRHHEGRSRAGDELRRLCEAGEMGSGAYRAAKAAWDRHHAAWCATYKKRYRTVEEYAEWLFVTFPPGIRGRSADVPAPHPDLASFRTVEEADAAWSRINSAVNEAAEEKQLSLPVGQPKGLKAFANPKSPKLIRFWRYFRARDLYSEGLASELGVRTLMTVDEQADGWHICFMQDNISGIGNVVHSVERLATVVYHEACAYGRPWMPRRSGLFTSLAGRFARRGRPTGLDPYRFHFYHHVPPGKGRREAFDRIALRVERGEYREPKWYGYRVIPELVRSARFDIARGGAPSGAEDLQIGGRRSTHDMTPLGRRQPFRRAPAVTYLPSFLLLIGVLPFWDALRRRGGIRAALAGVNAAVVGLLLAAFYTPVWTSAIFTPADFALGVVAFLLLAMWAVPPWLVVILGALAASVVASIG